MGDISKKNWKAQERGRGCGYRRSVAARDAEPVADFIARKLDEGLDFDSVLLAVEYTFPGISLLTFCGGLMLYRARSGSPSYRLIFPSGGRLQ